jgi:creatinine amidohydrolase
MRLWDLTSAEAGAASGKVAILPLGAIEQHGPHLPVSTDAAIAGVIAEAVERELGDAVVLCPALPFGSSHHHLAYPGTMSLAPDLFTQVTVQLVRSLLASGFRRIVLLNGHGGNVTPVRQALALLAHEVDDTLRPNIALATYWELAGAAFAGAPPMETPALCHACEYETSMMLELFPERVRRQAIARGKRPEANAWVAWEDDQPFRGVSMVKRTHFVSDHGGSGEPHLATAAKGRHLVAAAVAASTDFVRDFAAWPLMEDLR